jgi:hypothetical protein
VSQGLSDFWLVAKILSTHPSLGHAMSSNQQRRGITPFAPNEEGSEAEMLDMEQYIDYEQQDNPDTLGAYMYGQQPGFQTQPSSSS